VELKVAIFIDGGYLDKILQNEFMARKIDYGKLSNVLSLGKEVLRTYYYNCMPYQSSPTTDEESDRFSKAQRFYDRLEKLPKYEVRLGKLAKRDGVFVQKGIDTLMSIDIVSLAASGKIEDAVLLAGDSDFVPAVNVVKTYGVNVTLFHSKNRNNYHNDLWKACDERHPLYLEQIEER
jgi:uncharacterized LabA/DUF88 family protein